MKEKLSVYLPGILLFFMALIVGLLVYQGYGIAWDEPLQREPGLLAYNYIAHGNLDLFSSSDADHGTGFELILIFIEKWMKLTDTRSLYLMRHIVTHVFFLISALSLYVLVFKLYRNKFLACLAFIILMLSPRIYAHSFFNTKDLPFLCMFIITFTIAYVAFEKNKKWPFFILGLSCGYATSIRVMGIMLAMFILVFLIIDWIAGMKDKKAGNKPIYNLLFFCAGFCLMVCTAWTYLWQSPVYHFIECFTSLSHYDWDYPVFLNGISIKATDLPWYYFPTWFFITNPILWLITGFAGLVVLAWDFIKKPVSFLNNTKERNFTLYVLCFIAPIFGVLALHSVIYDDWRHLYFVYPSFLLIGIYCLHKVLTAVQKNLRLVVQSLCGIQLLLLACFMVSNHPFQQVYFNELVSHKNEYLRKHFELDYWGCGYKQGLDYILSANKSDSIRVYSPLESPLLYNKMLLPENDRKRIKIIETTDADYMITNFRGHPDDYPGVNKQFSIKVLNSTILGVYTFKKNIDLILAHDFLQSKQFDSAIAHFRKVPPSDEKYAFAQSSVAEIYANHQNFDSAEVYMVEVVALRPDDANSINNLGCMYMANKKYPLAIEQFKRSIALNPKNINACSNLGRCLFFTQQYQAAIDMFGKERELDPKSNIDIPYIGMSYQKLGNMDSVLKYKAMMK